MIIPAKIGPYVAKFNFHIKNTLLGVQESTKKVFLH